MAYLSQTNRAGAGTRLGGYQSMTGGAASDGGSGGPFGFVGNVGEGLWNIARGLGGLAGSVVTDAGKLVAEGATLGAADFDFKTDDIFKTMVGLTPEGFDPLDDASILGAFVDRWSPLLPGGEPASMTYQGLYEDPVGYGLDLLMGAGAAVKGAGFAGRTALAGTEAATTASRVAAELAAAGGVSGRTARAAGRRAGLDELAQAAPLPPLTELARRTLPAPRPRFEQGAGLVPSAEAYNPLIRAAISPVRRFALTESLDDVARRVGAIDEKLALMPGDTKTLGDKQLLEATIRSAQEAGLSRIEKPGVARYNVNVASRKLIAELKSRALNLRERQSALQVATAAKYIAEDPSIRDHGAVTVQGLDVDLPEYDAQVWAERQGLVGMAEARSVLLRQPVAAGGGGVMDLAPFGDELLPDEPAAALLGKAEDPIAVRTEQVVTSLREFTERMERDRGLMMQGGWDVDAEIDGARRAIRGLYDGLRRHVEHTKGADVPAVVRWQDEARLNELEELSDGFVAGGITPRGAMDRAYRPLRAKYGLDYDYESKEFAGGPDLEALDDALHARGIAQPVYFAHMDTTRLRTSDFFTSNRRVGANIVARDPNMEQMRLVLLKRGTWERDPIEVARRRAARHVRAEETYHMWDQITKRTGIAVSDPSMIPHGFALVSPDQLFIHYRSRTMLLDEIDKALTEGMDPDAARAVATRKVMELNQADVARLQEAGQVKMYAVPEVVLKNLDSAARWAPAFGGPKVRLHWDTPLNVWRGIVLTASPRWIINNALGGVVLATMQGAKFADVLRIFGEKYRTILSNWARRRHNLPERGVRPDSLAGQVQRLPGAQDIGSGYIGSAVEQYRPRLGPDAENTAMGRAILRTQESRAGNLLRRWGEASRHLNAVTDDAFREASFLTAIEKGQGKTAITRTARSFWRGKRRIEAIMADGFDEAKARVALKEVGESFGQYGAMAPFERHVIRRWLFPFWAWYKFSTLRLLKFPVEQPGRAQVAAALGQVNEEMLADYGPVPEWLEGALPMGPPGSDVTFLTTRGADPFSGMFQPWTSMLNPFAKVALEQAQGRDSFTGDEFSDPNVTQAFGSDQHFRIVRDDAGNVVDVVPVDAPRPGILEHLAGQVPQFDLLSQLVAGGKTYDTAPFTPITDETGEPMFPVEGMDQLARFLGYNTIDYDLARYQEQLERDRQAALTAAMNRFGG